MAWSATAKTKNIIIATGGTGTVTTDKVFIRDILWNDIGTDNDDMVITDGNDVELFNFTDCGRAGYPHHWGMLNGGEGVWADGIKVSTLSSGIVHFIIKGAE